MSNQPAGNGSTDRLLGKLLNQTETIERDIRDIKSAQNRMASDLEARIGKLEMDYASASGGMRMLILLCGAAATIGGLVAGMFGKFWGG